MHLKKREYRDCTKYDMRGLALEVEDLFIQDISLIGVLEEMSKAVEELKAQVARLVGDVKGAADKITHPESSDAEVEAATADLKAAADALEAAMAPKKEDKKPEEAPVEAAPVEAAPVEAAPETPVQ